MDVRLTHVSTLRKALGVDPRTIRWMYADEREQAFGRDEGIDGDMGVLVEDGGFGGLTTNDSYFVGANSYVHTRYGDETPSPPARDWTELGTDVEINFSIDFANNVIRGVRTFITVSSFDRTIYTPAISTVLSYLTGVACASEPETPCLARLLNGVEYVKSYPNGLPRSGAMFLRDILNKQYRITMPGLYDGGHTVPLMVPGHEDGAAQLWADVMHWYIDTLD
jgi:hypothetical protein